MTKRKQRRRAAGEGTILKLPNGRFQARLTYYVGTKRRYRTVTADTEREVLKRKAELEQQMAAGIIVHERQTLAQYLERWLTDVVEQTKRPGTLGIYRAAVRRIVRHIGKIQLSKLNAQHIQSMLVALRNERDDNGAALYAPATLERTLDVLQNALNQAVRWRLIASNPALLIDPPKVERYQAYALSRTEIQQLLAAVKDDRLKAFYYLAITLGLREGELLGLRWQDIDLDEGVLHVRMTLDVKTLQLAPLKTDRSRRTLPLSEAQRQALREHKALQLREKAAFRDQWRESGLVFTTIHGTPVRASNLIKRSFKPALERAGLPSRIRIHDLRHTCTTHLLQHRPLHVVAAFIGDSVKTTAEIYAHLLRDDLRDSATVMDDVLSQAG
jgi:integrase